MKGSTPLHFNTKPYITLLPEVSHPLHQHLYYKMLDFTTCYMLYTANNFIEVSTKKKNEKDLNVLHKQCSINFMWNYKKESISRRTQSNVKNDKIFGNTQCRSWHNCEFLLGKKNIFLLSLYWFHTYVMKRFSSEIIVILFCSFAFFLLLSFILFMLH